MRRLLLPFMLASVVAAQAAIADESAAAQAPSREAMAAARAACQTDIQKLCAGVQPGGGRIVACLKEHKDQVSDNCKQALVQAKGAH